MLQLPRPQRRATLSVAAMLPGFQHIFATEHENKTTTLNVTACSKRDIMSILLWNHESTNNILFHTDSLNHLCCSEEAAVKKDFVSIAELEPVVSFFLESDTFAIVVISQKGRG